MPGPGRRRRASRSSASTRRPTVERLWGGAAGAVGAVVPHLTLPPDELGGAGAGHRRVRAVRRARPGRRRPRRPGRRTARGDGRPRGAAGDAALVARPAHAARHAGAGRRPDGGGRDRGRASGDRSTPRSPPSRRSRGCWRATGWPTRPTDGLPGRGAAAERRARAARRRSPTLALHGTGAPARVLARVLPADGAGEWCGPAGRRAGPPPCAGLAERGRRCTGCPSTPSRRPTSTSWPALLDGFRPARTAIRRPRRRPSADGALAAERAAAVRRRGPPSADPLGRRPGHHRRRRPPVDPARRAAAPVRGDRRAGSTDPGTPDARLEVDFRPDPQQWPADLLAADLGEDRMNPGTDWIEQGRRLLETLRSRSRRGRALRRPPPRPSTAPTAAGARCARPPRCARRAARGDRGARRRPHHDRRRRCAPSPDARRHRPARRGAGRPRPRTATRPGASSGSTSRDRRDAAGLAALGIDIGGTKVAGGVVGARRHDPGRPRAGRRPAPRSATPRTPSPPSSRSSRPGTTASWSASGIGAAGWFDRTGDTVLFSPHLAWRNSTAAQGPRRPAAAAAVGGQRRRRRGLGRVPLRRGPRRRPGADDHPGHRHRRRHRARRPAAARLARRRGGVGAHARRARRPAVRLRQPRLLGAVRQRHGAGPDRPRGRRARRRRRPRRLLERVGGEPTGSPARTSPAPPPTATRWRWSW